MSPVANPRAGNAAKVDHAAASAADDVGKDPLASPENRRRVELAKNFAFQLLKGIKQIGMYRHNESKFPEFLQKAADAIGEYTAAFGPLQLQVEQQNLQLLGQDLFTESSALPYKFYRDGIRQLIFRPGLEVGELVTFTLIALSEPERGAEDLSAQLWRSQLPNVEYIMVEGFKLEGAEDEQVQVEVDKVVNFLQGRLRTNSDDYLRFARVSAEDLDAKLDGVEQIRGVVVTGTTADPALKARIQKEALEEESQRLFPKLVAAVFQVVESGIDDVTTLEQIFLQLLDAMLFAEDLATINQVVLKFRAMEQRAEDAEPVARLRETFLSRMAEEQRIERIGDILRTQRPKNAQDIARYLQALEDRATISILNMLETVDVPENRALVCDVLVEACRQIPEPFVARLGSDHPRTVRDMLYIVEKANHPDRIKMFGEALKSPNLAIRLEAMNIIGKGRTGEARRLIAECLSDAAPQVRMNAARLLNGFERDKAYIELMKVVKDPAFEKRDATERSTFYAALGATGQPGAISFFQQQLGVKASLFNKKAIIESKVLVIAGLVGVGNLHAFQILKEITEDHSQPPEVVSAARKAGYQLRKALSGGPLPGAPDASGAAPE